MASKIDICNMALGKMGISQFIADLDEPSNEARSCRVYYDNARDKCLAEIPWNFACKTEALADISTPPDRWAYRFRYPIDCIQIEYVDTETTPYEVVADPDNESTAICCDVEAPIIVYTSRMDLTRLYPPYFIDLFAWALALDIAPALAVNSSMVQVLEQGYRLAVSKATARNLNEVYKPTEYVSELMTARL